MKKLLIVTACLADNAEQIFRLKKSCEMYSLDFKYFGLKKVFRNWKQAKIDLLVEFLREEASEYEHILYTDGFDSWMLAIEEEIIFKFESAQADIVLSAEKDCYPLVSLIDKFPQSPTPFRFPCAGQFMGKTAKVIEVLSYMQARFHEANDLYTNDQACWQTIFLEQRFNIKLDYGTSLFLAMNNLAKQDYVVTPDNRILVSYGGNKPTAMHFNGPKNEEYIHLMDVLFSQTVS